MKNLSVYAVGMALAFTSCGMPGANGSQTASNATSAATTGAGILGSLVSNATSGANLGNIITSVIGLDKVSANGMVGTWTYKQPGVAFTSESTLAAAGGEVVAATCKEKLTEYYQKFGFKPSNTSFVFNSDGTYTATVLGKSIGGTYTFDEKSQAITLNIAVFGVNAYSIQGHLKQNIDGIALLFESKKILTILQTIGAMSGNQTINTVTEFTSNYNGVRIGFDLTKK